MDRLVPINMEFLAKITGFPTIGAQPEEYLENKAQENEITEIVKAQFEINRGNQGIVIKYINNVVTSFTEKLMAFKLLRKCRKEEALAGVIEVSVQCTKGVMFRWEPYLLNQFLIDYMDAQDNGTDFHYSWLLILITFVGW